MIHHNERNPRVKLPDLTFEKKRAPYFFHNIKFLQHKTIEAPLFIHKDD